jgi:hypothetical protein
VSSVEPEPTLEQAAERASLRNITAREIADHMEQPLKYVLRAANDQAIHERRPIDDVLRDWFRILVF